MEKGQKNYVRQVLFPLLAALIWGTAFVAQSVGATWIPPLAFTALRSFIAVLFLLPLSRAFDAATRRRNGTVAPTNRRDLLLGGLCCGTVLAVSSNLQQAGLSDTSAGKAGFLTAFYVVLVPVFGVFLKKRAGVQIWVSVALAVAGLYFLCFQAGEALFGPLQTSDLLLILCAVMFALHILSVDHFVQKVDGIKLSCAQFAVTGTISTILSLCFETVVWNNVLEGLLPLLYVGVFSSGVAFTLQILSQKGSNPTVVSLLFSLESVFSVLAGALILGDRLTGREYAGCVLMFAAVILAQVPFPETGRKG